MDFFILPKEGFLSPSLRTRSVLFKVENEAGEDENGDEHDEKD